MPLTPCVAKTDSNGITSTKSSICKDMSRHLVILYRHIETLSRHIETCLDTSAYCLHTSRQYLETLIIALENSLERKKIMCNSYNGLERYVSICNLEHAFLSGF